MKIFLPGLSFFVCILAIFVQTTYAQTDVSVSGAPLIINGADKIPVGMFGVHATTLNAATAEDWGVEMVRVIQFNPGNVSIPGNSNNVPDNISTTIDCFWDRYHPALQLTNPTTWQSVLEEKATNYANSVSAAGVPGILEFWNEPYLNWASKPAVNYDPRYYEQEDIVENGPVSILGQTEELEHMIWKNGKWFEYVSGQNDGIIGNYVFLSNNWSVFNALQPGQEATVQGRTFRCISRLMPVDTTQASFYSSFYNGKLYDDMLTVFGTKLKSLQPDIPLLAGWGMNIFQENWRPWHTIYKPTIDANISLIDGVHEHHYGGDTRTVTASYEVVSAYTDRIHNKRLKFYNTEAGGQLDPQQPGNIGTAPVSPVGAMTYSLRDIIFNLSRSPDKAVARATHQAHLNGGDPFAFRMLKPLRGEMIYTSSSDDNVWVVSSKNENTMTVVLFNDSNDLQTVNLQCTSPLGLSFAGAEKLSVAINGDALSMNSETLTATGTTYSNSVELSGKTAVTYVFNLGGNISNLRTPINIDQFFAAEILETIGAGETKMYEIPVPTQKLDKAESVRLKFIVRNYNGGGVLNVNGTEMPLQVSGQVISYMDIPKSLISSNNQISYSAGSSGFQVWMTSLELIDSDQPDAPIITGFAPNAGAEGDIVTISGSKFTGASEVLFGDISATIESVTHNAITVIVPAKTLSGHVKVVTPEGVGTSTDFFEAAPFIDGINPMSGIINSTVTIGGGNFTDATVKFNELEAEILTNTDQLLRVKVPPGAETGTITITTGNGQVISANTFEVIPSPIVDTFYPEAASAGMIVKITGTNFSGATRVRFGPASTSALVKNTDTEIEVIVPKNATTGPIGITTVLGTTDSESEFTVL